MNASHWVHEPPDRELCRCPRPPTSEGSVALRRRGRRPRPRGRPCTSIAFTRILLLLLLFRRPRKCISESNSILVAAHSHDLVRTTRRRVPTWGRPLRPGDGPRSACPVSAARSPSTSIIEPAVWLDRTEEIELFEGSEGSPATLGPLLQHGVCRRIPWEIEVHPVQLGDSGEGVVVADWAGLNYISDCVQRGRL